MVRLEITQLTLELLPLVHDFDCGDLDYQREVSDWIKGDGEESVREAIRATGQRAVQVWLYSTPQDGIVGFGSLCRSNWSSVPGGRRDMPISLIPNVGIDKRFHGYPPGPDKDARYSSQIMRYLIYEARQRISASRLPLLGLFVHPENHAGRKLYTRVGFRDFPQFFHDEEKGVTYQGMILRLAVAEGQHSPSTEEENAPSHHQPHGDVTTTQPPRAFTF